MKYNIQFILANVAMLIALSACSESYPGLEATKNSETTNQEGMDKTPIMLYVNEQDIFSVSTRGTGAFDSEDTTFKKLDNSTFYVYAFRSAKDAQGPLTSEVDLRKSAYSTSASSKDSDNESCLVDGSNYNLGMSATSDHDGALNLQSQTEVGADHLYYSSMYQDVGYNFFAYYIDNFKPTSENTHRSADKISYDIDIDGMQDILCGSAPSITDSLYKARYSKISTISDADKNKIINIGAYSTFAAHRGVDPQIDLKHALTRLRFTAYPGDENANNITINKIVLQSRTKGTLTVAARDKDSVGITFSNATSNLSLHEASPDGIQPCAEFVPKTVTYTPDMESLNWYDRTGLRLGESMMLCPDTAYIVTLYYTQAVDYGGTTGVIDKQITSTYKIKAPQTSESFDKALNRYAFMAGKVYDIKVAVYGLQTIKISVTIAGWQEVETPILIDPDQDPDLDIR